MARSGRVQPSTLRAVAGGLRGVYVILTVALLLTFWVPALGWQAGLESRFGAPGLIHLGIGWCLLGILIEHLRGSVLRGRQAWLAQALLRISPELKRLEAVRILIQALESDDRKVVETAHRELQRLTQEKLGPEPQIWRQWLRQQERAAKPGNGAQG